MSRVASAVPDASPRPDSNASQSSNEFFPARPRRRRPGGRRPIHERPRSVIEVTRSVKSAPSGGHGGSWDCAGRPHMAPDASIRQPRGACVVRAGPVETPAGSHATGDRRHEEVWRLDQLMRGRTPARRLVGAARQRRVSALALLYSRTNCRAHRARRTQEHRPLSPTAPATSASKAFKTNVWRTYQALDLDEPILEQRRQVALLPRRRRHRDLQARSRYSAVHSALA